MNRGLLGTAPPVARARVFAVALALALGTTSAAAAPADAGSDSGAADAVTAFVRDLEAPAVDKDVERAIKRARAHGRDLESSLAALDPGDPGVRDALRIVRAIRGLSKLTSTDAVRALAAHAGDHGGVFRWETGEAVAGMGERAVPGLIIEWRAGATPAARRFAGATLESMEKRLPGEAIQTKSPELLAEVLRAYGIAKDLDALGVVLSFANADRDLPRSAARQALVDYGPVATGKLREAYASFVNRPAPDDWAPDKLASELFAAYDRDRRRELYQLFDDAVATAKAAQAKTPPDPALLEKAVQAFDKILARAPSLERRAEMAPTYVLLAQASEATAPERAMLLYQRALALDPESPRAPQIQAGLLALEAHELHARGVDDEESLKRARALDPTNAIAERELTRLDGERAARTAKTSSFVRLGTALVAGLAVLLALVAVWRKLRST